MFGAVAGPAQAPRAKRSDARRNVEAILAAARDILAAHPRAAVQEIAEAAGVHRATVHRHFPQREDLVRAVRERILDDVLGVLRRHAAFDVAPGARLEAATRAVVVLGDRTRAYRYAPTFDDLTDERSDAFMAALVDLLAPAQQAGALRRDLVPEELASAWGGLLLAALPGVADGRTTVEEAAGFVLRLLQAPSAA